MAKVPQQLNPTVQLQAVRGPNARNVNLGPSPFEQPLAQWAQTFDNIRKREVKASSQDALLQYEREVQDLLYADGTGYTHLRGKDAMSSGKGVMSRLEDLRLRYSEGLEDPDARALFDSASQAHLLRSRQTVMNHADRESKFYQSQVLEAEQQTTLTNGALFYNDPSNFALEFGRGEHAVMENLQLQGLDSDPDVRAAALQKYRSGFYANGVTAALGNQDLKEAERLLAQGDPVMDAGTKATLKNRVRILRDSLTQKNDLAIAQSVVDQVWNPDGATREQMAAAIRKRLSGKREKSAIADLNQRWAEHKDTQQTDEESATRDAMVLIQQGTHYEDLPVEVISKIKSGGALKSLERYSATFNKETVGSTNKMQHTKAFKDATIFLQGGGDFKDLDPSVKDDLSGRDLKTLETYHRNLKAVGERLAAIRLKQDQAEAKKATKDAKDETYLKAVEAIQKGTPYIDVDVSGLSGTDIKTLEAYSRSLGSAAAKTSRQEAIRQHNKDYRDAVDFLQGGGAFSDLTKNTRDGLTGNDLKSLQSLYWRINPDKKPRRVDADYRVANAKAISDFNEIAARSLSEAANLDLTTFGEDYGVDSSGMSKLIELKSKAKRGEVENPVKLLKTATNHPMVKQTMQTLYADIDPKTDFEKLQNVQLAVTQALSMLLQDPQYADREYLGPDEYNQLAKDLIRKARTSDDIEMAKIPPASLLAIQTELKEAGNPLTPGFIVQAHQDKLQAEEGNPAEHTPTGQMGRPR